MMNQKAVYTDENAVSCDGGKVCGDQKSMHPRIYLTFDERDQIVCPYCSQLFIKNKKTKKDAE